MKTRNNTLIQTENKEIRTPQSTQESPAIRQSNSVC